MKEEKILIEIGLEEMAYISLALDRLKILESDFGSWHVPEWEKLQKKWDKIYKATHELGGMGIRKFSYDR